MPNFFDLVLKPNLFKQTTTTFGYDASWVPALGTVPLLARVHFKDPVRLEKELVMERNSYDVSDPVMEYSEPDFPGLLESVQNGGREYVHVKGVMVDGVFTGGERYCVTQVLAKWDGETRFATLVKEPL